MVHNFLDFSNRASYNISLKHFRHVTHIVKKYTAGAIFADLINDISDAEGLTNFQILSIVNVLLTEKFKLKYTAVNVFSSPDDVNAIIASLKKWNKFDISVVYHHPQLGVSIISNLNDRKWEIIEGLGVGDYLTCYVKALDGKDVKHEGNLLNELNNLFSGNYDIDDSNFSRPPETKIKKTTVKTPDLEAKKTVSPTKEEEQYESSIEVEQRKKNDEKKTLMAGLKSGKLKMSPKYSCQVTNELFHNGNVEAWKNIIESYNKVYPDVKIIIFHNGERINNINTLFKWGKVKSGDAILFSLIAENFQSISKLQRYFFEGASNRFNKFLKKDINKALNLF